LGWVCWEDSAFSKILVVEIETDFEKLRQNFENLEIFLFGRDPKRCSFPTACKNSN
jgi:hypothetical protein